MRHHRLPSRSSAFLAILIPWLKCACHRNADPEAFLWTRVDGLGFRPPFRNARAAVRTRRTTLADVSAVLDGEPLLGVEAEASNRDCDLTTIERLTIESILRRGQPSGLSALNELAELSALRTPFDFECVRNHINEGSVLTRIPGFLPRSTTDDICSRVQEMQERGWLSTNPDSVDGQPSCHINLISNGRPVECGDDGFGSNLRGLIDAVVPAIYQELLPRVQAMIQSTKLQVGDVFIRRYGQDVVEGKSRSGLSAHYDVYSMVTSVIALDDTGAQGTNGLYTTILSERGETSNHAALRRFFPLSCGDAVAHTWDILHGVDVQPNVDRTSLIVWFTSTDESTLRSKFVAPWVLNRRHEPVGQFVLASALEETKAETADEHDSPFDLYLQSALSGSSFSQSRLGALCEGGELSEENLDRAEAALDRLQSEPSLQACIDNDVLPRSSRLARRFWLEASLRGNPFAQIALAEEVMSHEGTAPVDDGGSESRLLAAVLFGLAAQQGDDGAAEALKRVVALEVSALPALTEEDFEANPIVQVAMASLSFL